MGRSSSRKLWTAKLTGKPLAKPTTPKLSPATQFYGTVLGVDPSLRGTGLAVVAFKGKKTPAYCTSITVKMPAKATLYTCLGTIASRVQELLDSYTIDHAAIEQTIYVQNNQTAQAMGAAKGAAIAPIAMRDIPVFEYAPLRIKQAVVGFGRASKEQMAHMMMQHLAETTPLPTDEADAAGVAFCHASTYRE